MMLMMMMMMMMATQILMKKMMATSFTQEWAQPDLARSSQLSKKSFHFLSEGQVRCACSYDQDYIIESTPSIFLLFFSVLSLTSCNTMKKY